jgi:dihydrolipoamide dehydrogenase
MAELTIRVPDIGDFADVEVIEVLVAPGQRVEREDSLITLESDKATLEVPSPAAGVVRELLVAVENRVSEGTPILVLEVAEASAAVAAPVQRAERTRQPSASAPRAAVRAPDARTADHAEVLVLGAGPGGYTAAFRAADLGKRVVLVERYPKLGGVCLNVGCIPSKALLHVAEVIAEAAALADHGVVFGAPAIDFAKLRAHKDAVVARLTGGLSQLAVQRKVTVVTGAARLASPHHVEVETADGPRRISFDAAILAAGSRSAVLPNLPDDPRILDSTSALEVDGQARSLLLIGGGIIGLEMAAIYDALGCAVTVVELLPALMTGTDPDLVRPLQRRIARRYAGIHLQTKVSEVRAETDGLRVRFEGPKAPAEGRFDRVLVAVGRRPNGDRIGAETAGVRVDERGFVPVDGQQRTNVAHIHAIGDLCRAPMLAHKAMHEGKVAAEVIAGLRSAFDARAIPSVAYTDPEVAWVGLTEADATQRGVAFEKALFPWSASGRALGIARSEGVTKLLLAPDSLRLLGAGIVGPNAGELIAELALALELGADAEDIALTVHPHPTLSETVGLAAQVAAGTVTDILKR